MLVHVNLYLALAIAFDYSFFFLYVVLYLAIKLDAIFFVYSIDVISVDNVMLLQLLFLG